MSEPSRPRPVPAAPTGAERPRDGAGGSATEAASAEPATTEPAAEPAATVRLEGLKGLDERPVSEHVDVFEAEHARLERELRTIDQL